MVCSEYVVVLEGLFVVLMCNGRGDVVDLEIRNSTSTPVGRILGFTTYGYVVTLRFTHVMFHRASIFIAEQTTSRTSYGLVCNEKLCVMMITTTSI